MLRGVDGGKQLEVDASGRPVAEVDRKHTVPGSNIHLTIDVNIQKAAEEAVKRNWISCVVQVQRCSRGCIRP